MKNARDRFVEKLYFFFHSGTIGKHNIIYKLTYTIVIINNLQKPSWAFIYIYIYFFCFFFLFFFFIGSLLVRRYTKKKKTWTERHGTRRESSADNAVCTFVVPRHFPLPKRYTGRGENDAEEEGEEEARETFINADILIRISKFVSSGAFFSIPRSTRQGGIFRWNEEQGGRENVRRIGRKIGSLTCE